MPCHEKVVNFLVTSLAEDESDPEAKLRKI